MKDGFVRCAAASPEIKVADCAFNSTEIIKMIKEAAAKDCSLIVFPELCITGYTCGDLFLSETLIDGAASALKNILEATAEDNIIFAAGLPVSCRGKLYNCAAVCCHGEILGLVPKRNIPNYGEFYEIRHFTPRTSEEEIYCDHLDAWIGSSVFSCTEYPLFTFGIEICEDLWVSEPPSGKLTANGALIIANLSASDETAGKSDYRRNLIGMQSARTLSGYIYADCGFGESTQDMVFSGHCMIFEDGAMLAEKKPFSGSGIIYSEIDLKKLDSERRKMNTFAASETMNNILFSFMPKNISLTRKYPINPFVPESRDGLTDRCSEILTMQAAGLASRLKKIGCKNAVIGLSGGLDSTLALIVTVHAFDMLGLDRKGILAITMPCFGTTSRTKNNALSLAAAYGAELADINISEAVRRHFADIGQSEDNHDVTYENSQARERTQVLMDIANQRGGIVVGTGDLSELALGWATYNGDHMSMYGVNASVPKTLVRHLVRYEADMVQGELGDVLRDVLDTPVSPELLPPSEDGKISQKTEDIVGPYELHDFFLYYMVRFGFSPSKIYRIASYTFNGIYDNKTILKWLRIFVKRFFAQQFKRSCLPDGPKVGSVTLSPRGDWRMPSDASAELWLADLDGINEE